MLEVIYLLLQAFLIVLIVYSILSWYLAYARVTYDSPAWKVQRVLSSICDPVLRPVRRLVPPLRIGGAGLDLSVLIVFLVIEVVLIPLVH